MIGNILVYTFLGCGIVSMATADSKRSFLQKTHRLAIKIAALAFIATMIILFNKH